MKKVLLLAAFGVAGMMSAGTGLFSRVLPLPLQDLAEVQITNKLVVPESEWCGTVTYVTTCGLPIQDSYCTSWGEQCLVDSMNLLSEYFCAP